MGRFKNKRVSKSIDYNEKGDLLINEINKFRVVKEEPKEYPKGKISLRVPSDIKKSINYSKKQNNYIS